MTPELLHAVEDIDAAWLQSVFESAQLEVPDIIGVDIEPIGAGNTGVTVKATLAYNDQATGAPTSVICKFHPADPQLVEMVKAMGTFVTEAAMLQLLAKGSKAAVPEAYLVQVSDDGGTFNYVCEDLSASCKLGDQLAGCSIDEARAATAELAELHRQYWNEPFLDDLAWIGPRLPLPENALDLLGARLGTLISAEQRDVVTRAFPKILRWQAASPSDTTLLHGDCRVDNILFGSAGGATTAYLIDFATASLGHPTADLAYLLTSSLAPADRAACEEDLLALHTAVMAEKDPTYTLDIAREAYRTNIVSSIHLTLFAGLHLPDVEPANALLTTLLERNCAAVGQWIDGD